MNEKMRRFLKSIHIENIDRFDLDFDLVTRNSFIHEQIDMLMVKKTPWSYSLLEELKEGLNTITYPYTLSISYVQKPTVYEAIQLFDDWHRANYRFPSDIKLEAHGDKIVFVFESESQQNQYEEEIKVFNDFLEFISYHFEIEKEIIKKEEDTPKVSQKRLEKIEAKANQVAEEALGSDVDENETYYKDQREIESEEREEELKKFVDDYATEMRANFKKLKADSRKGFNQSWRDNLPYEHFDDFSLITGETGNIDVDGEVFGVDTPRTDRFGKMFVNFGIGKGGAALNVRAVENEYLTAEDIEKLKNGMFIRLRGYTSSDRFTGQLKVTGRGYELLPPPPLRDDKCEEKRVELHLHTKMSTMDGVSTIAQYCELAKHMGHKAIAVTDHGVTQSYPDAQDAAEKYGIKMLYGCELYVVNDELPFALNPKDIILRNASYVVFDLETTGLSARYDRITEFGAIRFEGGQITKKIDIIINPEMHIPEKIQIKTKITDEMVKDKPTIKDVMPKIKEFIGDAILVSHNINFDVGFLNENLRLLGEDPISNPCIDTLSLSRYMFPESRAHSLGSLSRNLGMSIYNDEEAHRADYDAQVLNEVWLAMLNRLTEDNFNLMHSDLAKFKVTTTMYKHMRPYHATVLVKDKQGLHDLYHLVSDSHTTYFADVPKTPKTELKQLREHFLVGSACFNGDVFDTARTRAKNILKDVVSFYDYIEVQHPSCYSYLIDRGDVVNYDEIKKYIKDIVEVADELNIPVVATGDVHYRDPSNKITRDIFISAKGVGGRPHPLALRVSAPSPDQYYRSTKEMLDAFEFLGKEKAYEIVVTNTNKIADQIEEIKPVQKKLHPPVIENSPELLRDTAIARCKELYGDPIPQIILDRLNKELDGIIGNGYSVTYYIAREIVRLANEAGHLVGSRGSVGSSLAAYMYGITEVNALPPHYRCPKCKHLEFVDDPNVFSGYDLPDKFCPVCGEKLVGDGQNIPFETFLGFNGEKIPDIDLNFPSDYQQRAFDSTKIIFGEDNVFRAGTIETVADKTAFGYVRGYYERSYMLQGMSKEEAQEVVSKISPALISYLASHCVDVRRTTGQHPGGIMVLPKGMSIYDFTPIQYPADDKDSSWYTTHLDYHAIHDALLKLDLLGHVDPLALRLMTELTGIALKDIPLNDNRVISLFSTDKALNRTSNYLKVVTGALGLPEFGTDTANDILLDAKPKSFADLVVIAGLAHGTDVWANNAQDLIRNGTCTIRDVIGCRDDIMTRLINEFKIQSSVAFKIMEDVRKGKKLKPEYEAVMKANGVPQWYIDSCNKIKYMFPKAHAVAYVTMAVRVGYFKVYHPLEFYAVWFSVRCDAYEIKTMLGGLDSLINRYEEIRRKKNNRVEKITPKEKGLLVMLKVAIEMAERGFKFMNIDLYKSDATKFVVDKENNALILPFVVLDGLGENAANSVIEARKNGKFTTKEDLLNRTKLNSTNVEQLSELGVLEGLGDTAQMTLFDFGFDMDDE